jgi:hypothetical protein
LPAPVGPAHHGKQRRIQSAQPRQDVVVELVGHLAAQPAGIGYPGHGQRQAQLGDVLAQPFEGSEQRCRSCAGGHGPILP